MSHLIDLKGQRFGYLVVTERTGNVTQANGYKGLARWLCRCDCGSRTVVTGAELRRGMTRSCGCLRVETTRARRTTHGESYGPEYRAWAGMIRRCENPSSKDYKHYGGRGVTVTNKWRHNFPAFFAHIGRKTTPKHSLDRIDNDRGYEPGNVRWATQSEQVRNSRRCLRRV